MYSIFFLWLFVFIQFGLVMLASDVTRGPHLFLTGISLAAAIFTTLDK